VSDPRFNELFQLTSVVSLLFQILATALIAVLSYAVSRAGRRRGMLYWSAGWTCYMASLVCVMFVSRAPAIAQALLFGYYFFEYAAVILIFAGCRYTARGTQISLRSRLLLIPAAIVALAFAVNRCFDQGFAKAGPLRTSWGVFAYDVDRPVVDAIEKADRAMYGLKAKRKSVAEGLS